jgi:hypothetical protein
MGLSKTAWYRRYKRKDLYQAWRDVCGRVEPDLADVSGLNSAQRQSQEAKKPGLAKLKRQLDHYG